MKKKLLYILAFTLAVLFTASTFPAQRADAITLIPPILEFGLIPGEPSKIAIKLFNESSSTVELYTEAHNFSAKDDTGQPQFDFESDADGISSWIDMEEGPIIIEPNGRYEVPVTINPPSEADPGGHYAAVFFSTTPPEEGQVRIASKVGTLILAKVAGDVEEDGSIVEFDVVDGKRFFNRLPAAFEARFENTGNVHLRPAGTIVIENFFGQQTDEVDFNPSGGATLPDTTRRYEAIWEKGQVGDTAGNVWTSFWKEYVNEKNNFAIGRYTAAISIEAGTDNGVTDAASVSFWIFPWRVVLVWAVAAALAVILLIYFLRRYNAWIVKKARGK
ncbi:MAG: hypothetical protein WC505_00280 [Patescibacteria group bacterium]